MATYRTCVADAKTQKQELEDTKVTVLRQIQEVIRQTDQTIKSVRAQRPVPVLQRGGGGSAEHLVWLTRSTPPAAGHHLLLPDVAHADGLAARALPDAV